MEDDNAFFAKDSISYSCKVEHEIESFEPKTFDVLEVYGYTLNMSHTVWEV